MKKWFFLFMCACIGLPMAAQSGLDVYNQSSNTLYYVSDWTTWSVIDELTHSGYALLEEGTLLEDSSCSLEELPVGQYRAFLVWEETNGYEVLGKDLGEIVTVAYDGDSMTIDFAYDYEINVGCIAGIGYTPIECRCDDGEEHEGSNCGCGHNSAPGSNLFCPCEQGPYFQWEDYNLVGMENPISVYNGQFKLVLYKWNW